jgi:hypothetical protein
MVTAAIKPTTYTRVKETGKWGAASTPKSINKCIVCKLLMVFWLSYQNIEKLLSLLSWICLIEAKRDKKRRLQSSVPSAELN